MPHCPCEQDTNQHCLHLLAAEELYLGLRAININLDLLEVERLVAGHVLNLVRQVLHRLLHSALLEVVAHNTDVLFSLSCDCVLFYLLVNWYVVAQQAPDNAPHLWHARWDARP